MTRIVNVKKFVVDARAYEKMQRKKASKVSVLSDTGSEFDSVASTPRTSMQEWTLSPGSNHYWVVLVPDTADLTIQGLIAYLEAQKTRSDKFFTLTAKHVTEIDANFIYSGVSLTLPGEQGEYSVLSIPFVPEQGSAPHLFARTEQHYTTTQLIAALERFQQRFTGIIHVETTNYSDAHPFFNPHASEIENNQGHESDDEATSCCAKLARLFRR